MTTLGVSFLSNTLKEFYLKELTLLIKKFKEMFRLQ